MTDRREYKRDWARAHVDRVRVSQKRSRQRLAARHAERREIVTCRVCGLQAPRGEGFYPSIGRICKACFKARVAARAKAQPEKVREVHAASYRRRFAADPERFRDYTRIHRFRARQGASRGR
jgi:hypothetical protein